MLGPGRGGGGGGGGEGREEHGWGRRGEGEQGGRGSVLLQHVAGGESTVPAGGTYSPVRLTNTYIPCTANLLMMLLSARALESIGAW